MSNPEIPWDWIQTFTGRKFYPTNPRAEDLDIRDIAHALSLQCRYAGHCKRFYSVAEHCVHVSRHAPGLYKLWGLLHDASEAYLVDIPRPIKPYLSNYLQLEEAIMRRVVERFSLEPILPMPLEVKQIDTAILFDERAQNLSPPPEAWTDEQPPLGIALQFWAPEQAERIFLAEFDDLTWVGTT